MLENKTLLITGGTGSFGNAIVRRFVDAQIKEIRIFSRDEKKQDDMRKHYNHPKIKFYLGDVRDSHSIKEAMRGVDYVFHAAALKQVPSCEFYPMQAVKTNIIGTENVLHEAIDAGIKKVIVLSTDKAVYPINAMGVSKAMMERIAVAHSRNMNDEATMIAVTRYGNVLASRGSVVPLFIDQIRQGKAITITNSAMTRFMMSLDQAVELVMFAFENGHNGDIFVQKAPAATVGLLAKTLKNLLGKPDHPIDVIGVRHGEKLYEALLTREEKVNAEDMGGYYRIPSDTRDLNYSKFVNKGKVTVAQEHEHEYNSNNTKQLSEEELKALLLDVLEVQGDFKAFGIIEK